MVRDEYLTLTEVMLGAERFCALIEARSRAVPAKRNDEQLRLKIGECRNLVAELQKAYDEDQLSLKHGLIKAQFRFLVMALIWVMFEARDVADRKCCRMLVSVESTFTYLLIGRTTEGRQRRSK